VFILTVERQISEKSRKKIKGEDVANWNQGDFVHPGLGWIGKLGVDRKHWSVTLEGKYHCWNCVSALQKRVDETKHLRKRNNSHVWFGLRKLAPSWNLKLFDEAVEVKATAQVVLRRVIQYNKNNHPTLWLKTKVQWTLHHWTFATTLNKWTVETS